MVGLQGFEITDSDLEAVANWKEIEVVEIIDGKQVTDIGLIALSKLPRLQKIIIGDTAATQKGISSFSGHATLTHFTLINTIIPAQVERIALEGMPKLTSIQLSCEGMKSIQLKNLPQLSELLAFPLSLEEVRFEKLSLIGELDFLDTKLSRIELSDLPKLKRLNVKGTKLPAATLKSLKDLPSQPRVIE